MSISAPHIHQFLNPQFSQFSYYIESNLEVAIIDPQRDIQCYIDYLEQRGARLKYILMTHVPSDYVSGHVDLNKETDAMIIFGSKFSHYGENKGSNYFFSTLEQGQALKLGNVSLGVVDTPGHSVESVSYSLLNGVIIEALFTGDTLLINSIGCPDTVVLEHYNKYVDKSQGHREYSRKDLCDMLYDTVYNKLFFLPTETIIYPGHSSDQISHVKFVNPGGETTIIDEKNNNPYFKFRHNIEGFLNFILQLESVVQPRSYCENVVKLNLLGYEKFEESLNSLKIELDLNSMENILKHNQIVENLNSHPEQENKDSQFQRKIQLIDTRELNKSIKKHLPGSILINLDEKFSIWTGTLINYETELVLITEPGMETEAICNLLTIGYYNIKGYFTKVSEMIQKLNENNSLLTNKHSNYQDLTISIKNIPEEEVPKYLYNSDYKLLDVREKEEFQKGSFSHSVNFPLSQMDEKNFKNNFEEVSKKFPKNETMYVFCGTGERSIMAVSILQNLGYKNLFNLFGGVVNIEKRGIPLRK
jgi:hydroxyacylglutathione hydrolase